MLFRLVSPLALSIEYFLEAVVYLLVRVGEKNRFPQSVLTLII